GAAGGGTRWLAAVRPPGAYGTWQPTRTRRMDAITHVAPRLFPGGCDATHGFRAGGVDDASAARTVRRGTPVPLRRRPDRQVLRGDDPDGSSRHLGFARPHPVNSAGCHGTPRRPRRRWRANGPTGPPETARSGCRWRRQR